MKRVGGALDDGSDSFAPDSDDVQSDIEIDASIEADGEDDEEE